MKQTYHLPTGCRYAPYLAELIEGNHTLIAGSTGAGKSVLENAIIYALLSTSYPGSPDHGKGARFVLIDPKRVELWSYRDLPHTLLYAADIDEIVNVLQSVRETIDTRLKRMRANGERKSSECPIYVFIDELVDLVKCKRSKEIIQLLSDSISIARATNIFYVISTQAPNRKILLPEIVLNMNCRVALFCNYAIESRQIIGDDSATTLPEHGTGIVQQNLKRYSISIPFYSDEQLQQITEHWTKQNYKDRPLRMIMNMITGR